MKQETNGSGNWRRTLMAGVCALVFVSIFAAASVVKGQNTAPFIAEKRDKPELIVQTGHTETVNSVAFSPDGRTLASGSDDNTIKLWNVESGQQTKSLEGHTSSVKAVAFSRDGKTLASGSLDKTIKLWNVESGEQIRSLKDPASSAYSVAFSPDRKTLASASGYGTIKLWSVENGQQIRSLEGHTYSVRSVAFSPDGKTLASGSNDQTIKLWSVETGQQTKSLVGHTYDVWSVAFSRDGKTLASGSPDKTIKLWNVETGEQIKSLEGHTKWINSVAFSPDDKTLASGSDDTIKLWNVESGQQTKSLVGHTSLVQSVAFSADGKTLASGDWNNTIKLWNVESGQLIKSLVGRTLSVTAVAFSPDGKTLASVGYDLTIKLWNVESGEQIKSLAGHTKWVWSVAFSPDGKTLASGSDDYTIKLWNTASGKLIKSFPTNDPKTTAEVSAVVPEFYKINNNDPVSPDSRFQIKMGNSGKLNLHEVKSGRLLASLIALDQSDWVVITPDGRIDTNKLERPKGLHWIMPDAPFSPLSFEVFMRDYYEPKLLPRLLRCTAAENCDEEFKPVRDLTELNRTQPRIEIKEIKKTGVADTVEVVVETQNAVSEFQKDKQGKFLSSGVYDLRLFRDGQLVGNSTPDDKLETTFRAYQNFDEELNVWREAHKVKLKEGKRVFTFKVKLPTAAAADKIEFTAYAFNDDRVKGETASRMYQIPPDAKPARAPRTAYVVAFGVNKYENPAWDLQFAANDARAMRDLVPPKLRERREFAETVVIPLISDDETTNNRTIKKRDATKGNVQTVFDLLSGKKPAAEKLKNLEKAIGAETLAKIKPAKPDDLLLFSFSSHGYADRNGIFYILPSDIGKESDKTVSENLLRHSISSDELSLWMRDIDAGEMVMIVDACHAASAVEGKDFKPAPMGSRGLGQLAFDKGMKILTATQAANVALESGGKIGHGLLTYALLREGLEQNKSDFRAADKTINLKEWLQYGEFRVPGVYDDLAAGKLKGIGKGTEIVHLGQQNQKNQSQQQPSLFDFTRKKSEMILAQLK